MNAALRMLVLVAGLSAAGSAVARYGFTAEDANVRAGPSPDFPLVAWLPVGTVVEIFGCVDGWMWCDVAAGPVRGFVYAGLLGYPYEGGYVIVRDAGAYLGLAQVPFVLPTYWGTWYVDRPWYPQWSWWASRPPPHRSPGRLPQGPPQVRPMPPMAIVPPMGNPVPRFDFRTSPPPPPADRPVPRPRPEPR